jgi:hypothetical protein
VLVVAIARVSELILEAVAVTVAVIAAVILDVGTDVLLEVTDVLLDITDVWLPVWVHAAMPIRNANSADKRNIILFLKRLCFLFSNK